jgi:hypothetical protein
MKVSMKLRGINLQKEKKYWKKNMSQYRFVCHKSHTGIEPEPPQ